MTYATTFSGIAGWELGLDACGWDLRWQCEADAKLQRFLVDRFGVPVYPDIRTLVDERPEPVDALIGSPPCQPFSVAGAQRGVADARHLFPAFLDAVRVLRPRWVLMEQVPAILSLDDGRAFGGYVGPLAALGYDLVWHCIPAAAVGAPHLRDRVWIISHRHQDNGDRKGVVGTIPNHEQRLYQEAIEEGHRRFRKLGSVVSRKGNPSYAELRRRFYGIPSAVDQIEGLGNAVLPQIPYLIGQAINAVEAERIA